MLRTVASCFAFLLFPLAIAFAMFAIARRYTEHPLMASLTLTFLPAVYVVSHTLMTDVPQLALWIERFFKLWCRNQWKRERYAPSFHLDDENLDPKTWCRFPILSGGYERELAELRKLAASPVSNDK